MFVGVARAAPLLQNGHSDGLEDLAYSPDGKWLASAGASSTRLWDASGRLARTFRGGGSLAWSEDGRLATSGQGLRVWNVESGVLQKFVAGGRGGVAWSRDGKRIVCGWSNYNFAVVDVLTGRTLFEAEPPARSGELSAAWSPDGTQVVVSARNYGSQRQVQAQVFAVPSGEAGASWSSKLGVFDLDWARDGSEIALAQDEGLVSLWNPRTGKTRLFDSGEKYQRVYFVRFSPDGAHLLSGLNSTVSRWNTRTGEVEGSVPLSGDAYHMSVSPDEKRFASRGGRTAVVSDERGRLVWALAAPPPVADKAAFAPDGRSIAFSLGEQVQIWNSSTWKRALQKPVVGDVVGLRFGAQNTLGALLFSREEELESGAFWTWNIGAQTLRNARPLPLALDTLSPDGAWGVRHGLYNNKIELLHIQSGKRKGFTLGDQGMSVAFGPPDTLASARRDGQIELWNLKTGRSRVVRSGSNGFEPRILALSPRASLVAGADFRTMAVWNTFPARGRELARPDSSASALAFSPDETILAIGDEGGTLSLWRTNAATLVPLRLGQHDDAITSLAWARDGKMLLSTARDGSVRLWNVAARRLEATLRFPNGEIERGWVLERGGKLENHLVKGAG